MSTLTRPIHVPKGDKPNLVRGSSEARFFQSQSRIARRREDAAAIQEALDWMTVDPTWVEGPQPENPETACWDEIARDMDDDMAETIWDIFSSPDVLDALDAEALGFDPMVHGVDFDPFHTLSAEDMRDLTVTQMFWGDTTDDREV